MTTSPQREPTNEQLWAQPPADASPSVPGQGLAPYAPIAPARVPAPPAEARPDRTQFILAIVSLGVGVPLTAIAAGINGLPGLLIVWIGIVLVNLAYGWTRQHH